MKILRCLPGRRRNRVENDEEQTGMGEIPLQITAEILSRLPLKTLMRYKILSKSWSNLILDPWFINLHRLRSRLNPNVLYINFEQKRNLLGHYRTVLTFTSANLQWNISDVFTKTLPNSGRFDFFHCVSSYSDLICFMTTILHRGENIFLYNPVSHQVFALPQGKSPLDFPHSTIGFGYVSSTHEYKVLRLFTDNEYEPNCEIITICPGSYGRDNSCPAWTAINDSFPGSMPVPSAPVFVRECLHWLTQGYFCPSSRGEVIVSFDMRTEKFSTIPLPSKFYNKGSMSTNLLSLIIDDFEGKLVLVNHHSPVIVSLWVLQDYDKHVWNMSYRIDFKPMLAPNILSEYHISRFMPNGELLILRPDPYRSFYSHYFYNFRSNSFRRVPAPGQQIQEFNWRLTFYWESMVTL